MIMEFSSLIFYSLLLLHVLSISASEISCLLTDVDRDGNNKTVPVSRNNIILKSIIQNENVDEDFEIGGYPLHMSLHQWKTLNHCYQENDLGEISSDEIIEAVIVANKIDTTKPIEEEEKSVMDVLVEKAKKIVTLYDFSKFDQNYIHQIEELKKLFNKVYFDAIKEDASKNKKTINKFMRFDDWWYELNNNHLKKRFVMFGKLTALLLSEFCVWAIFILYFDYIKSCFGQYYSLKIFCGCLNITATLLFYNFFMIFYKTATQGFLAPKKINFNEKKELYRFHKTLGLITYQEFDANNQNVLKKCEIYESNNNVTWGFCGKSNDFLNLTKYNDQKLQYEFFAYDIRRNTLIGVPKNFCLMCSLGDKYYVLSKLDYPNKNYSGTRIWDGTNNFQQESSLCADIYIGVLLDNKISNMKKIYEGRYISFLNNQCIIDTEKEYITFSLPSDFNNFLHQKHAQRITRLLSLSFKAVFLVCVSYFLAKGNLWGDWNFFDPFAFDSFEEYDFTEKRKKYMPFILKLFNTIITYQENFFTYQLLKYFSKEMLMQTFLQKNT